MDEKRNRESTWLKCGSVTTVSADRISLARIQRADVLAVLSPW